MSVVIDVNDRTWETVVEKGDKPALVMFHSPSCAYCFQMMPFFEQYAVEYKDQVNFFRMNIMENSFTPERYGVMSTPTFKFFCNGRPIKEIVGAAYPSLLKKLVEDGFKYGEGCISSSTRIDYDMGYV
jgi:thioredoxin-like negative regulator of GroEL